MLKSVKAFFAGLGSWFKKMANILSGSDLFRAEVAEEQLRIAKSKLQGFSEEVAATVLDHVHGNDLYHKTIDTLREELAKTREELEHTKGERDAYALASLAKPKFVQAVERAAKKAADSLIAGAQFEHDNMVTLAQQRYDAMLEEGYAQRAALQQQGEAAVVAAQTQVRETLAMLAKQEAVSNSRIAAAMQLAEEKLTDIRDSNADLLKVARAERVKMTEELALLERYIARRRLQIAEQTVNELNRKANEAVGSLGFRIEAVLHDEGEDLIRRAKEEVAAGAPPVAVPALDDVDEVIKEALDAVYMADAPVVEPELAVEVIVTSPSPREVRLSYKRCMNAPYESEIMRGLSGDLTIAEGDLIVPGDFDDAKIIAHVLMMPLAETVPGRDKHDSRSFEDDFLMLKNNDTGLTLCFRYKGDKWVSVGEDSWNPRGSGSLKAHLATPSPKSRLARFFAMFKRGQK